MVNSKPIIFKPRFRKDKYNLRDSKFRKTLDVWKENGLIDIIFTDSPFCWLNRIGNVLLFDFDIADKTHLLSDINYDKLIDVSDIQLLNNEKNISYMNNIASNTPKTNEIRELDFDNLNPDILINTKYGILSECFINKKYEEEIILCMSIGIIFVIKEENISKFNFLKGDIPKIYEHFLTFETVGNELYNYDVISKNCIKYYDTNYSINVIFYKLFKDCYLHDVINLAIHENIYDNIKNILEKNKNYTVKKINYIKIYDTHPDKKLDTNIICLPKTKGIQSLIQKKELMHNIFLENNISTYITNIEDNYERFMPCPALFIDEDVSALSNDKITTVLQKHIHSITLESFYTVSDTVIKSDDVSITPFLNIITQYCNHKNDDRQNEFDVCVLQNLNNKYVENVYLLNEPGIKTPKSISEHPKCIIIPVEKWLTYKMAFDFSYKNLVGKVCILCNLDIFIDPNTNWKTIESTILDTNIMFCLSRYEFDGVSSASKDPNLDRLAYCNAQDAWIFKGEHNITLVEDCDFEIGLSGCDNAIADRLYRSGYVLINSPNTYKIFHYDLCRQKDGTNYVEFHKKEDKLKTKNSHPEKKGYRLLPDIDKFKTLNDAQEFLGIHGDIPDDLKNLQEIEKYTIICNMFTRKLILNN
tara:strand:- start:2158 stop:4089 length:1932 start_codon:yes stop_codon:yes gene_type:complete